MKAINYFSSNFNMIQQDFNVSVNMGDYSYTFMSGTLEEN